MALYHVEFKSSSLLSPVEFRIIVPNDVPDRMKNSLPAYSRPMKTLMLLHGAGGVSSDWITGTSITELAAKYNLAVIMPSCRNSFYLNQENSGERWADYVGEELINYCRKAFGLSVRKEDTFIGGLSMGGYGALHTGLCYPQNYSKIITLSGAYLVFDQLAEMKPGTGFNAYNYAYYDQTFGGVPTANERNVKPQILIKELLAEGRTIQPVFSACGTEDPGLRQNRELVDFLRENNLDVTYVEGPGVHNWAFWAAHIEEAIVWALGE